MAQAEIRDPTQPILVYNTEGHSSSVMALVFTPDGSQLLSAGRDKVIHVWNLAAGERGLARTIRPPIWRGPMGTIFALALSPVTDEPGQRTLAVAGYGMQSALGTIGLYRYPGRDPGSTGEVVAMLSAGIETDPEPQGHWNTVKCLAFAPGGRFLASGSYDATVRIWDYRARRTVAILRGHRGPVRALSYSPDGRRLVTAGEDGDVVLWDVEPAKLLDLDRRKAQIPEVERRKQLDDDFNRRAQRFRARPHPQDARSGAAGVAINALAVSPDGRWIVIGRENGRLIRYQAANLGGEVWLPRGERQAAVEALAFSPDSARLAVSLLSRQIQSLAERPWPGCDVEIRSMPDGRVVAPRLNPTDNVVYALAFSPDGRYLAYAGGDEQAICLKDLRDPRQPEIRFVGQGRSLCDVGFSPDGQAIGYWWERDGQGRRPSRYWGFDLLHRKVIGLAGADLRRARETFEGATLRPIDLTRLQVDDGRGGRSTLALDPQQDGRWWSYSFIPPAPDHPRWTVAVGTESGLVVLFARDSKQGTYQRVRVFNGHSGAVYALAPSPDGKWLVTGSADQTARLWLLKGCDARPPLGASLALGEDGRPIVKAIEPRGFAEAMGLEKGDAVEEFLIGGKPRKPAEALTEPDRAAPGLRLEFRVRRGDRHLWVGTTKRDSPALSLFPGRDREWVLWMPHGYYDTSIAGDRRFLGWHRNGSKPGGVDLDLEAPTDYFAIDKFEPELRRPEVLDRLLQTADLRLALDLVPAPARVVTPLVRQEAPPRVQLGVPARPAVGRLVVAAPALQVLARAVTEDLGAARRAVASLRFLVDSQLQREVHPGQPEAAETVQLALTPGVHKVNVEAINDRGRHRIESFEVEY
ncbi:MAG: PD40 domain-containing protein, partial [Isosphaeraceae bacterium]|nr:PD40 domain-containing protein [Isosphaeraceae bacterium]